MDDIREHFLPWTRYLWRRFNSDGCMRSSAALTYMSLFALVPLMTVMFAILSAIPDLTDRAGELQELMFNTLFPGGDDGDEKIAQVRVQINDALADFSTKARNLSGPGVGVLIVTAVLMLRNVEATFNTIWRARKNRSPISSFLLYWAVLSLGPILIGLALGAGAALEFADKLFSEYDVIGLRRYVLSLTPLVLSAAAFSLLYAAVPNCRVKTRDAIVGGAVTAILFNAARWLFAKSISKTSYSAIYGAFAAFPLLLLWIYLSWNIVLLGAVLVHSLSTYRYEASARMPALLKALVVLNILWQNSQSGASISEFKLVKKANEHQAGLDSETWNKLRDIFIERKLVVVDEGGGYLLGRDLHSIAFWQLKEWVTGEVSLEEMQLLDHEGWRGVAQELVQNQRKQQRELLHISVADLFAK